MTSSPISVLKDGLNIGQQALNISSQQLANQDPLGTRKEIYLTTDKLGNPVSRGVINAVNEGSVTLLKSSAGKNGSESVQGAASKNIAELIANKEGRNPAILWGSIAGTLGKITARDATSGMVGTAFDQLCQQFNKSEQTLQMYRQNADRSISNDITRINAILTEVQSLNTNLERLRSQITTMQEATIQDQRRALLVELSQYMNFQEISSSRSIFLSTPNGLPLLNDEVHPLQFNESFVEIDATISREGGGLSGIFTDTGVDITDLITSGQIHGNLQVRDVLAPKYSDQLSDLTREIYTRINQVFNTGTPFPPPTTLTGTVVHDATESVTITGAVYVTVLDANGTYVSRVAFEDETLTLEEVRDRISANGDMTATLAAGGNPLVITGDNNRHVGIGGTGTIEIAGDPTTQTNFSHFFGFHNAFKLASGSTLSSPGLGGHIQISSILENGILPLGSIDTNLTTGNVIAQNKMDVALKIMKEFGDQGTTFNLGIPPVARNLKNHLLAFMTNLVNESKVKVTDAEYAKEDLHQTKQMFQSESGINAEELVIEAQKWLDFLHKIGKVLESIHQTNNRLLETIGRALTS